MIKVCGEADGVCEETVAPWFTKYQVPALEVTCLQLIKKSGPVRFCYWQESLYRRYKWTHLVYILYTY
jgi:hypothetical protein